MDAGGETITREELIERLPAIAEADPIDAAQHAAEILLRTINELEMAREYQRSPAPKLLEDAIEAKVRWAVPLLQGDLLRTHEYFSVAGVCDRLAAVHPGPITIGGATAVCYVEAVYRIGKGWLVWLLTKTVGEGLSEALASPYGQELDTDEIIKQWPAIAMRQTAYSEFNPVAAALDAGLYQEYIKVPADKKLMGGKLKQDFSGLKLPAGNDQRRLWVELAAEHRKNGDKRPDKQVACDLLPMTGSTILQQLKTLASTEKISHWGIKRPEVNDR